MREDGVLTVDRIHADIDGPAHRFTIRTGDVVEVFLGGGDLTLGRVVETNHRGEALIAFDASMEPAWVKKEKLFPAPICSLAEEPGFRALEKPTPTPPEVSSATRGSPDPSNTPLPYTLADHESFLAALRDGTVSAASLQAEFARIRGSEDAVTAELVSRYNAREIKSLAGRFGYFGGSRATKKDAADAVYRGMLRSFVLTDSVCWSPLQETFAEAISRLVAAVTDEAIREQAASRAAQKEETARALTEPETLTDFHRVVSARGEKALSDEQLARFDQLQGETTRAVRLRAPEKTIVEQIASTEAGLAFQIVQGFHEKRNCPVWVVKLSARVERATFDELIKKAKELSGWYSSFKRDQAGFQFLEESTAKKFASLLTSDADRSEELGFRAERRKLSAAERLREVASGLSDRAEDALTRDRLENTGRRACIAASARADASRSQAIARTILSVADALENGAAKFLGEIRTKVQVELLLKIMSRAKRDRVRTHCDEVKQAGGHVPWDREEAMYAEPASLADIRFVRYPYPAPYASHLAGLVQHVKTRPGCKQAATWLARRLPADCDAYVTFSSPEDIQKLRDFLARAKTHEKIPVWVEHALLDYDRLHAAELCTLPELRVALRELLPHIAPAREEEPVKKAERELIGQAIPGFFPTPRSVIERMLELAQIEPGMTALEPSCGKGDILDAMLDDHPEAVLAAIEVNRAFQAVLTAKGHEAQFTDFLTLTAPQFDRIVMNPPFESGQDIDHVRHAYSLLSPDGRLVSVMSAGPFFREDKQAREFRAWLEALHGTSEELPAGAFAGSDAFRRTGVSTRLVVIDKEEEEHANQST